MKYLFLCLITFTTLAQEQFSFKEDFKDTFKLIYQGAYKQFMAKDNLYVLAAAVPALSHTFDYDVHYRRVISRQKPGGWLDTFNDIGTITTFPVVPGIAYYYAQKMNDQKLRQFTMELTATTYLSLTESALLSYIDVHERPSSEGLSKWETDFRGDSSFVSGHMIPLAALALKSYQYYGALYAALPAALSLVQSYQRVNDDKHWMSDVIGGYFVVLFADNGVRKAWKDSERPKQTSQFFLIPGYQKLTASYYINF